jgi:hypothetical protein
LPCQNCLKPYQLVFKLQLSFFLHRYIWKGFYPCVLSTKSVPTHELLSTLWGRLFFAIYPNIANWHYIIQLTCFFMFNSHIMWHRLHLCCIDMANCSHTNQAMLCRC